MSATITAPVESTNVNASVVPPTTPEANVPKSRKTTPKTPPPEVKPLTLIQQLVEAAGKSSPSVRPAVQFDRVVGFARALGLPCASLSQFRDKILSLASTTAKCRDSASGSRASVSLDIVAAISKVRIPGGDAKTEREIVADLKRQWAKPSKILAALECESDSAIA